MDDNGMWTHKSDASVNEIRKIQSDIKMRRLQIGGHLSKMNEAYKHLPDKKFEERVKEDCDISKAGAYRYMKVYEELKWWPDLVHNLKWSVIEKIATSNLPQDWKKDLMANGDPNLKNKVWDKYFKEWAEGKIKRGDAKHKAMIKHRSDLDEYRQRRKIEQTDYIPYIENQITAITRMIDNLTADEAGRRRAREIVPLVEKLLNELSNILKHNSVPPSFNPQQRKSQNIDSLKNENIFR